MNKKLLVVAGAFLLAALPVVPAHGWQATATDHAKHHPGGQAAAQPAAPAKPGAMSPSAMDMMASKAKLDELVKKMNSAQGQAKVDAMAELLTALVQTHQSMNDNMSHMMEHMGAMHGK
jgi:hypothetical protein